MTRPYNVCGIGNAIVDIFLELNEAEFASLDFERGTMRLTEKEEQEKLIARFHDSTHDLTLVSGGSVANSIIALSELGGKGAFIGCVGDDRYGMHYASEFTHLNIALGNPVLVGETTGTCIAIVTPDAERTMRTCLAVSSHLAAKHVDEERIKNSDWVFIEGYVFANPATGQHAIREVVRIAKLHGTKVALTCSDAFIPAVFGDAFRETLAQADLLFANASEAESLTNTTGSKNAFTALASMVPNCVVTDGPHGAFVRYDGIECHVPAFDCTPKDVTGAGDMFAGAFLYGITQNAHPAVAARGANFLAMKVISQVGARLKTDAQSVWREATAGV